MLADPDRELIRQAFDVPVYDSYGLREGGLVGHECSCLSMHTMDEQILLETIDPHSLEPTNGEGELVLTNLFSTVMPVIRYRTGDLVTLSKTACSCGRTLGSVKVSGGRVADFVVTSDGRWIPGYAFIYVCRSIPGIVQFQALQDRLGEIRLMLVTDADFPSDGAEQARRQIQARLASDETIVVQTVDAIAPAPSGKYRPVISQVAEQRLRQARDGTPDTADP